MFANADTRRVQKRAREQQRAQPYGNIAADQLKQAVELQPL